MKNCVYQKMNVLTSNLCIIKMKFTIKYVWQCSVCSQCLTMFLVQIIVAIWLKHHFSSLQIKIEIVKEMARYNILTPKLPTTPVARSGYVHFLDSTFCTGTVRFVNETVRFLNGTVRFLHGKVCLLRGTLC